MAGLSWLGVEMSARFSRASGVLPRDMQSVDYWFEKSRVDYRLLFVSLYLSYVFWYKGVLGVSGDRRSIDLLKRRTVIWEEFLGGYCMPALRDLMTVIYEKTQQNPLYSESNWDGRLRSSYDWQSLIEYWYATRCGIFHGMDIPDAHVELAYLSLDVYMCELRSRICLAYGNRNDYWGVDMVRFASQKHFTNT